MSEPISGATDLAPDLSPEDLRTTRIHALRGPNYWRLAPVIARDVELGALEHVSSADIPGFSERLTGLLPSLQEHECPRGVAGGFVERLHTGTHLPHDSRVVRDGLLDFNRAIIGDPHERQFGAFVRDEAGRVIGGLLGHVRWKWVYVSKLWVPDELRGRGVGTRLMREVETFARRLGCHEVYLDTFEYQGLPFYEKLGYEQFGVLEGVLPDTGSIT